MVFPQQGISSVLTDRLVWVRNDELPHRYEPIDNAHFTYWYLSLNFCFSFGIITLLTASSADFLFVQI